MKFDAICFSAGELLWVKRKSIMITAFQSDDEELVIGDALICVDNFSYNDGDNLYVRVLKNRKIGSVNYQSVTK